MDKQQLINIVEKYMNQLYDMSRIVAENYNNALTANDFAALAAYISIDVRMAVNGQTPICAENIASTIACMKTDNQETITTQPTTL